MSLKNGREETANPGNSQCMENVRGARALLTEAARWAEVSSTALQRGRWSCQNWERRRPCGPPDNLVVVRVKGINARSFMALCLASRAES